MSKEASDGVLDALAGIATDIRAHCFASIGHINGKGCTMHKLTGMKCRDFDSCSECLIECLQQVSRRIDEEVFNA